MSDKKVTNSYDDGNIPNEDLPRTANTAQNSTDNAEPLPESSRPRRDGPGGD